MSLVANFLAEMPQTEWGDELLLLYSELHTVRLLLNVEEPPVLFGGFSAVPPGEDVGLREETLEAMAAAVENIEHQASGHAESAEAPDFDNKRDSGGEDTDVDAGAEVEGHAAVTPAFGSAEGKTAPDPKMPKLPRVDPPPVEDEPGQAIREDTPGYIAQAFPRLSRTGPATSTVSGEACESF